jgi:hypothetical protein
VGGTHLCEISVPGVENCGPEPSIEGHLRKEGPVSLQPQGQGNPEGLWERNVLSVSLKPCEQAWVPTQSSSLRWTS